MRRCAILTRSPLRPESILRSEFNGVLEVAKEHFDEVLVWDWACKPELLISENFQLVILVGDFDVFNCFEACRRLKQKAPKLNLLVLADAYRANKFHNQLKRTGATGLCIWNPDRNRERLSEAIQKTSKSLFYWDAQIRSIPVLTIAPEELGISLTDRESEVLLRIKLRTEVIAQELQMRSRSLEKHIECLMAKFRVASRYELAFLAQQLGYELKTPEPGMEEDLALQEYLYWGNKLIRALLQQNERLKENLDEKMCGPDSDSTNS